MTSETREFQGRNRGNSAKAVQAHYDIGNEFYGLWLDPTLSYSCALWEEDIPDEQLEVAQRRKIEYHVQCARARGTARVLDVGSGWGAMLRYLVEEAGVGFATGLTLSQKQAEYVQGWQHPKLEVRLESWTDHTPSQAYDAIVSIGAFEHFARSEWSEEQKEDVYRDFFQSCHRWLKPGGWLSLQSIAYGNIDPRAAKSVAEHRFLLGEVFPEAELPSLENILHASSGLFELVLLRNDREDYARTCRVWNWRLTSRRAEAEAIVEPAVVARYVRYLKMAMGLFHYDRVRLLRLALRRIDT